MSQGPISWRVDVQCRVPRILAASLLLALACAHREVTPPASGPAQADRSAILQVLRDQQDAWNRGDLDAFLRGYDPSPDLVFTSGGNVRRGFAETRARYFSRYGAGRGERDVMGQLAFEVLDVRALGDDGAVVLGRWRLTGTPEAGGGVFSLAFLRTGAGWRIVHDHTSSDAP
jgi:ketosteroid isomerase-like protein